MSGVRRDRAIVIGGSIAGLFAARVLSDHFAEVVVVDRDEISGVTEPRRGVPQGRQVHGLQARGQIILEELFPGITKQIVADGGVIGDMCADIRWFLHGKRMRPARTGLAALTVSRPFLERYLRERVAAIPQVRFVERCNVLSLETTADRARVTGVRMLREEAAGTEEVLDADLVVDAAGRGSRVPAWLTELGYPKVEEERKKIGLGYTTRQYRIVDSPYAENEVSIGIVSSAAEPRGAIAARIEDDRVTITAYGLLGDHPPTDPEGFDAFLGSLRVPDAHRALAGLEPVTEPVGYRFPANQRRRYERMGRFPAGLLVTGDGVCSFNPTYAQGMTVAAVSALVIRRHVAGGGTPDPLAYLRDLAREAVDGPWELMAGGDLAFPGVEGERTFHVRLVLAYMRRLQEATTVDERVADAFMRVFGLVDPPGTLMRPGLAARVLTAPLRRRLRPARGSGREAARQPA
ncbi:FAD-dependent oxidoreductase [Streptomyces marincola]|uniref:FAD-dependent oxidoreductase n=1 Tax=Streptomyces marincola TaxID=2878388 RepID=UPI001CF1BA7E|nr:FAD-dependent monooxygenase [Streptomyces marincola]